LYFNISRCSLAILALACGFVELSSTESVAATPRAVATPLLCEPGQPACGHPTPTPTPKVTFYNHQNGLSELRASSTNSAASIVLGEGQTGTLSFICSDDANGDPCPSSVTSVWNVGSLGAGISQSLSPTTTTGGAPVIDTITIGTPVAPNTYQTNICFNASVLNSPSGSACYPISVQVVSGAYYGGQFTTLNKAIASQATVYFNEQYDTSAGPACVHADGSSGAPGSCACAWVINRHIFADIGVAPVGLNQDYVPDVETALKSGRGSPIPLASALPGDIDIQADAGHIGICVTAGCTVVYSNSSSRHGFLDSTGPSIFLPVSTPGRIYRLNY
jgi:hypothetical protein